MKKAIITIVVIVLVILAAIYFFLGGQILRSTVNQNTYQAVFLNNGQVYFGKLSFSGDWLSLKDVYYLQATTALQSGVTTGSALDTSQQKVGLVKLGSELHGPEDQMFITKGQVLFWENMKSDSKVLSAIKQYSSASH